MNEFEICQGLNNLSNNRKYYVYRLVDPRTLQTFYVGKGCGDRVFQHVKDAQTLIGQNEDALSLKIQQIADILACGKQVISIIHRRGITSAEAFEVEAALIDAYPGLTNIQRGHDFDRGCISIDDLRESLSIGEYTEPDEKYIIIKTTPGAIMSNGSLYEATRKAWRADLSKARKYKYVLSVIYGIVREVYEVSNWEQFNTTRIAFVGKETNDSISSLKGKRIPATYRKKGASNPFLYKK